MKTISHRNCLLKVVLISIFLTPLSWAAISTPISEDPLEWLNTWLIDEKNPQSNNDHRKQQIPTIMATLATVDSEGQPTTRTVQISFHPENNSLVFYTHQQTQKVSHIQNNPLSAVHLWMPRTKRQVEVRGYTKPLSQSHAKDVWMKMPRWMQLNMTASDHHSVIDSRETLQRRVEQLEASYPGQLPYNENFVAYEINPTFFSFYAANLGSFADKFTFVQSKEGWRVERRQP